MSELVTRRDEGGLAILSLNRPEVLNALSASLFQQLQDHIDALNSQTDEIGVVILRGEGRSFSAGNDLKAMQRGDRHPTPHFAADVITALEQLAQPVIGAIHGHCYTGALELALACDVLLVAESARFADTHARWGMTPTWGMTARLPNRIGLQRAKQLILTGATWSGREAVEVGLASECVPDDQLEARVREIAERTLANSWYSLRYEKQLVNDAWRLNYPAGLAWEREHSKGSTPDLASRLADFGKK